MRRPSTGVRPGRTDADAVIVGAGYAGPLIAAELAQAGLRVIVLEAGPERRPQDLVSSQIASRELRGPYYTTSGGDHPLAVGFNIGWGLGGSGTVHFGAWPRMHPVDFEIRSRFGRGLDWPIGYEDLRNDYDAVQRMIGLSGDSAAEPWRPPGDPYPLPPLEIQRQARTIARGFDALGLRLAPTPMAVLSRPYDGREACRYVAWCNSGCAIGALGHPLVTVIPRARKAGVRFVTDAHVTRVMMEGDRASGVEVAHANGKRSVVRARTVVLAAYSLETPRILLNSGDEGVANSSGLVGKYMHAHTIHTVFGMFPEETEPHRGTLGGQHLCQDMYDPDPAKGYFGGYQWLSGVSVKPNDLIGLANTRPDIEGAALEPFLRRAAKHLGAMDCMGSAMAYAENALTLSDERDRYGMRKAHLQHTFDADAMKLYDAACAQGTDIMRAAGADEVWASPLNTAHIMGGTIMGDDPATSVATSYGQTHDVENLYVAGSGLFPICGAANPTFTLSALALRSSRHIRDALRTTA